MKTWEVIIPPAGGGALRTLIIEAATSMMALSEGLHQLSDPAHLSSLMCKILPHGTLEVVDNKSRRTITIREIDPAQVQAQAGPTPATQSTGAAPPAAAPPAAAPPAAAPPAAAPPAAAPPASVPPPDPGATGAKGAATAVGLPAMGGQQQPSAGKGAHKRRQTQEMISTASGIAEAEPTPPPALASPPVAAPPVAAPPPAGPVTGPAPPPTAEIPTVDPLRSSGEVMGASLAPSRHITEPAIIIDDHLQEEIEQLESLRKAREAAMTPPAMRPIPHKVFKVLAEAPEAPRFETVRRRYVSVWPNPPQDALEEVLQIQIAQVRAELEIATGAKRVLVATFDHAFEKIPLRPPLGLCTWNTSGPEDPAAGFVYGDKAAALWNPAQPSTGSDKSPMMVPALNPDTTSLGRPASVPAEDVKTAIIPAVDAHGRPTYPAEQMPTLPAPGSPVAAPPPVQYPAELQGNVYDTGQPAPPPNPPTGTLDPFYPSAHAAQPAPPTQPTPPAPAEPTDLLSMAFQRFQPLFYITDRNQAFAFAIDTALGLVPSQAGVLLLYDYQARNLYSAVIRAPGGAQIPGYRTTIGEGMAGFCATQGLPLALSQEDQDARFSTVLGAHCGLEVSTLTGVPIQYQGHLYGVLELANRQAGGSYSTEELNALAYIGRQLAERLSTTLSSQMPAIQDPGLEPKPS